MYSSFNPVALLRGNVVYIFVLFSSCTCFGILNYFLSLSSLLSWLHILFFFYYSFFILILFLLFFFIFFAHSYILSIYFLSLLKLSSLVSFPHSASHFFHRFSFLLLLLLSSFDFHLDQSSSIFCSLFTFSFPSPLVSS